MRIEDFFYLTLIVFIAYYLFSKTREGLQDVKYKECSQKSINDHYSNYIFKPPARFARP